MWLSALVTHGNVPGELQTRPAVVHSAVQFPGCRGNDKTLHCHLQKTWGNRVLNEDCHHSHHCNSAEVTWLSPSFYQCSQTVIVRNHLALQTAVQVGEGCTCQHSHLSPWKGHFAVESTKDSPQWGWHWEWAEISSMEGVGAGWCCCHLFVVTFIIQTHQEVSMKNWPIPNPHFLDVSYLAHILWVRQIQASDFTDIWLPLVFSYLHLHHPGKKPKPTDVQFHEERCHSPPGAYGKYYREDNFA